MKKIAMMVFALFLTAVFMPCKSFAEDISGKLGVGGNWFYYLENEADFKGEDLDNEGTPEAFNLHVSYCLPRPSDLVNINLILDWEYISRDMKDEESGIFSDDMGTTTMMPLMVGAQVRFANLGIVTPYVGFALGISFNSVTKGDQADEIEEGLETLFPGRDFETDIDVDHSFAFKVPVGMDIFITDFLALNIEAKYFYTKPEYEFKIETDGYSPSDKDEIDQSSFAFGAGLSLYF